MNYKYGLIDLSYLLARNVHACAKLNRPGEYTAGDLVRTIIQTINKISRDYGIYIGKYIFLSDSRSEKYGGGYYRSHLLRGDYKTSRHKTTREDVETVLHNPKSTREDKEKIEASYYQEQVRKEARNLLLKEMGNFGIPCVSVEGWEYDDLARVASILLYSDPSGMNSVIISKDSDLLYTLTPRLDYFRIPGSKESPRIYTYQEMVDSIPEEIRGTGISLYDYKGYLDSLGAGHNDMKKTKKARTNTIKVIQEVLNGVWDNVEKPELFKKQLSTFYVQDFPEFMTAQERLMRAFTSSGRLSRWEKFKEFCDRVGINGEYTLSERFYSEFISRLDKSLYNEDNR